MSFGDSSIASENLMKDIWLRIETLSKDTESTDLLSYALTLLTLRSVLERTNSTLWADIQGFTGEKQHERVHSLISTVLFSTQDYQIPEGMAISNRTYPPAVTTRLIAIISDPRIGQTNNSAVSFSDLYQFLLSCTASSKSHDFLGPPPSLYIQHLIAEILRPQQGSIFDPCVRSGQVLAALDDYQQRLHPTTERLSLFGQENDPGRWRQAQEQALIRNTKINLGSQPLDMFGPYVDVGNGPGGWWFSQETHPGLTFDFVASYPPTLFVDSNLEFVFADPRWEFGAGIPDPADFAWLQLAYHHLRPGGTAAVVLSRETLSSDDPDLNLVRTGLISEGVVRCIICLPHNENAIPTALWICIRPQVSSSISTVNSEREILLIDLSKETSSEIDPEKSANLSVQTISDLYHQWNMTHRPYILNDLKNILVSIASKRILDSKSILDPIFWL